MFRLICILGWLFANTAGTTFGIKIIIKCVMLDCFHHVVTDSSHEL